MKRDIVERNLTAYREAGKDVHQLFLLIRSYIEHEDGLINQRTNWFLTLNSFLFATVGLISNIDPLNSFFEKWEVYSFLLILSTIGVVVSVTSGISVNAAYNAIKALKALWVDKYEPDASEYGGKDSGSLLELPDSQLRFDPTRIYPYIKGGGWNRLVSWKGRIVAFSLFYWVGASWLLIAGFAVSKLL